MKGLSLFANVGIAETYMKDAGVDIAVANEMLKDRAAFYQEMYPECNMIVGDITDTDIWKNIVTSGIKNRCDFMIATPPCQGMSIAGKMEEGDERNSLVKSVVDIAKRVRPDNILIENVERILNTHLFDGKEKILIPDYIKSELEPLGYIVNYKVVNTAEYGTPQTRKRAIFLISLIEKWEFPPAYEYKSTVRDAIAHLPSLESGEDSGIRFHKAKKHNERHILCMKHTPSGKTAHDNVLYFPTKEDGSRVKGFKTTYKRIEWDKPAPTITMANGSISSQNNVHPGRKMGDNTYTDARVLTLKEVFILSGLPNNWNPPEWASENMIREVIGEGVPPMLIKALLSSMPRETGYTNE